MSSNGKPPLLRRALAIPARLRLEQCRRLPEFGPRILFLSGGSALREISRRLKDYTHNSIHLITPFDSGGSSALLRRAFGMLSVGDLRNRMMALADESAIGNRPIGTLFSYRLGREENGNSQREEFGAIVSGTHRLVEAVDPPLRKLILVHLRKFAKKMPVDFDLRGASIGNLILSGGYLANERDIESVLYLFTKLVSVRGVVRPTSEDDLHLAVRHESGEVTVGQHRLGKPDTLPRGRIEELFLVERLDSEAPVTCRADEISLAQLGRACVICYPVGSFFGSVLANLLPAGVGRAIRDRACPKIYLPNAGSDPEMRGYSLSGCVRRILEYVRRDAGDETSVESILDFVAVDTERLTYDVELDLDEVRNLGVEVIDTRLGEDDPEHADPRRVVELLVSMS